MWHPLNRLYGKFKVRRILTYMINNLGTLSIHHLTFNPSKSLVQTCIVKVSDWHHIKIRKAFVCTRDFLLKSLYEITVSFLLKFEKSFYALRLNYMHNETRRTTTWINILFDGRIQPIKYIYDIRKWHECKNINFQWFYKSWSILVKDWTYLYDISLL